ncbi:MAG TPA: hypothetical protein VNS10_21930 [Gemmatimonadaceae bacterium]|jgi:hypothetical protein|nr:hypothetical protein [Gemmatimonadaceae bacterium]
MRPDSERPRSFSRLAHIGAWGAPLSAVAASLYLAVAPTYETGSADVSTDLTSSHVPRGVGSATLAAVNGPIVFGWFAFCVLVAAMPLVFRRTRFARAAALLSAALLLAFVVVGSASIGATYVPAAAFALLAAAATPASRPAA